MMARRLPRGALRLALVAVAVSGAFGRQIPVDAANLYDLTALGQAAAPTHSWPRNALFLDPWVRENIALTYAHQTRDGVGAQTMRLMGIYAIAKSLDLQYLHRPIQCVGHMDGKVHFRNSDCQYPNESERQLMNKLRHMVTLPSNVTEQQVAGWEVAHMEFAGWARLTRKIRSAYLHKLPTLLTIEFPTYVLQTHPDMYFSVPAFRPEQPTARLVCRAAAAQDKAIMPGRSWLLNALRIAVHFRRGDIAENKRWQDRMLPVEYYVNVVKSIVAVMDAVGCDFTVEVFAETPSTPEGKVELQYLQQNMPAVVMLVSTDLSWSWQMMATADILVMSNSAFSLSAAIMNPNALNIYFPNAKSQQGRVYMNHWHMPTDMHGTLPPKALEALRARLLMFQNTTELPPLQGPYNVSQQAMESILPNSMTIGYSAAHLTPASVSATARPTSNGSFRAAASFLNLFSPAAALPAADPTAVAVTAVGVHEVHAADAASTAVAADLSNERVLVDPFAFGVVGSYQAPTIPVPVPATPAPAAVSAAGLPAFAPPVAAPPHAEPLRPALPGAAAELTTPAWSAAAPSGPGSLPVPLAVPAPMMQV